jgi:hypothetical protein
MLLRLLFGPGGEVAGTPDRPDGFTAAAAACHILALDNLDQFTGWLRDKIARLTTGAVDFYRRLYTSNEMGRVTYRCYLACTARTPDTLRRDDLADRLLILPVTRVEDPEPESILLHNAQALRNAWWGDVLTALNQVVALIRHEGLPTKARLRMADFESFAQVVAKATGQDKVWERTVRALESAQAQFLLDGEPIVDGLCRWLQEPGNEKREMTARELYEELTGSLFGDDRPGGGWYKSPQSFAKKLANIRRDLRVIFEVDWEQGTAGHTHHRTIYRFSKPREVL